LNLISHNTKDLLMNNHEEFIFLTQAAVVSICKLDVLSIPEYDLFLLVSDWAVAEAEREGLDITAISSLRFVLLNVLPHIRFPCMNHEKLAIEVRNSGLLNAEELTDLFAHCLSAGKTETKYSSKIRIRGSPQQLALINTAGHVSPGLPASSPSSQSHSQTRSSPPSYSSPAHQNTYSASSPAHQTTTLVHHGSSSSSSSHRNSSGSGSGSGSGKLGGVAAGSLSKHSARVLTEAFRKNSDGSDTGSDGGRKRSLGEGRPEGQMNAGKALLMTQLAERQTDQPSSARSMTPNKQDESRRSRSVAPTANKSRTRSD